MARCCKHCGIPINKKARKDYCTVYCRQLEEGPHCAWCGKPFIRSNRHGQKFCSKECSEKPQAHKGEIEKTRKCRVCGYLFIRHTEGGAAKYKGANEGLFCSKSCRSIYFHADPFKIKKRHIKRLVEVLRKANSKKTCDCCGKLYIPYQPNKQRFCCNQCNKEYYYQNHEAMKQKSRERDRAVGKVKLKHIECRWCGEGFETYSNARFCSDKCKRKGARKRERAREKVRKRKIESVTVHKNINAKDLHKRDKAICAICGQKVDLRHKAPHPRSATVDHILPLSKGGWHEWSNVQLAHFECNCFEKRDNMPQNRRKTLMQYERENIQ